MNKRSTIYLAKVDDSRRLENFTGKNGKKYARLWTIKRVVFGRAGVHASFGRINGSEKVLDGTAPEFVDALPRDAVQVPNGIAELLHKANAHYFGNLRLTEDEMKDFLILEGKDPTDSDSIHDHGTDFGFKAELVNGSYQFRY